MGPATQRPCPPFHPLCYVPLMCSVTITKCDLPDPHVEFKEDYNGLKASVSGLSVAVTGEINAQWGIMWVFLNLYPVFKLLNNEATNLLFLILT